MTIKGVEFDCNEVHTINYATYKYFPGFCSYMNHKC